MVVLGGLQHFSVSLSPLGTNWVLELIGTWLGQVLGGFGTRPSQFKQPPEHNTGACKL